MHDAKILRWHYCNEPSSSNVSQSKISWLLETLVMYQQQLEVIPAKLKWESCPVVSSDDSMNRNHNPNDEDPGRMTNSLV